ncbi:MAG: hypothetical protein HZB79_07215 [Deltaproteobacteria bacterium]|nr:hypothetical protein [Deltaproteobacteria bacterium]
MADSKETDKDNTVRLWDIETGKEIRTFTGHAGHFPVITFSPDGRYALSGSDDKTLKLWDIETGKDIRTFTGHTGGAPKVTFSPDGRYVLTSSDKVFNLWDVFAGRGIRTFTGHADYISSVSFSPDGRYALSGSDDKTLKLWDIETGKDIRTFTGHTNTVYSAAISPDGRYALSRSGDKTLRLWDISTGRQIWTVQETKEGSFGAASFSRNGGHILAGYCNHDPKGSIYCESTTIKLFDALTGREIRTFSPTQAGILTGVHLITLSPDGRYALTDALGLWEISNGRLIRSFKKGDQYYKAISVAFSPDGMYVISGNSMNGDIDLWDVATGGEIKALRGHNSSVGSVTFSPDGKYVFSGSGDNTARIWDISTGKEIAQFISFTDGEWIVITPEGYYNSSANGDKHLNVRIGNNVYGIDQYRSTFYKPQIVEAALKLGDTQKAVADVVGEQKVALPTVSTIENIEPPFIVIKSPEEGKKLSSADAEISLYVEDRNQTIKKVTVYVNGRTVTGSEIASASPRNDSRGVKITPTDKSPQPPFAKGGINIIEGKKTLDLKIPVHLETGENLIEITAFNGFSEGRKSIRIYSAIEKAAAKGEAILPNLWILSIGINKYQDKNLTPLSYAVADAEGIIEAFKGQKGKLFREIKSLIINDNSPIKPTRDNITDNLNKFINI